MASADSASAIQQCKERLKVGKGDRSFPKTQTIIGLLSKARNKEISIGDVLQRDAQHLLPHADALESIGEAYRGYRRQHGLLDYDDLLFELEDLLKGDPEAGREGLAERFRERYRYIMVDEYQDTNRVQARLVRLLAGEAGNVMAVGDDAQSIYAFRGADVRNILDFPKLFPGTRVIRLEENYRSTQPVLDVANAVLAPASEGFRKNLFTTKENTPKTPRVRLVRPMSDLTQANVVAARVEELLDRYQAKEIAVLFRAGYQSYHLEVALSKRGIKFRKYGGPYTSRTWWRSCGWRSTRWTCPPSSVWRGCPRAWGPKPPKKSITSPRRAISMRCAKPAPSTRICGPTCCCSTSCASTT